MALVSDDLSASADGAAIARSLEAAEAFAMVFDRHFVAVHRYLARRVGRDQADDLASQTFLLAFAHRGRYRDDLGTARPWLLGIATNLVRADRRAEQRRLATLQALGSQPADTSATANGQPGVTVDPEVAAAVAGLDPPQRDALLLHVWGELSYAEVAVALDLPVGTVRSRISRACAALRENLTRRSHA
jgi:RNA polymerase sigma-70 factor (ECF subfamily)